MWGELKNRRRFFEEYAREERFDPLVSSNWYSQPRDFIMSFKVRGSESEEEVSLGEVREEVKKMPKRRKEEITSQQGAEQVMSYHKYRVSSALLACFPDIGLDTSKLQWHIRLYLLLFSFVIWYYAQ